MSKPFCIFDIETTRLDDFGHMLAATIGEINYDSTGMKCVPTTLLLNDFPGETLYDDKWLVQATVKELEKYNCVVGWYSKGFDAKFIRRRLLHHRLPDWTPQLHLDLYYMYKCNFKTGEMSCRLAAASEFLELPEPKMTVDRKTWKGAWYGETEAMEKIRKRCESDVQITAAAFQILLPFAKPTSFKP